MPLASQLRSAGGAPLGDVFTFFSSLYFRGKLTYARHFAAPRDIHVITPTTGLAEPRRTRHARIASSSSRTATSISRTPATGRRSSAARAALLGEIGNACDVVLLGSIASPKYVGVLGAIFGERLRFPVDFVGRGDMSRGGLLLRKASEGVELDYVPVAGAVRHGPRPPRLPRKPRG